MFQLQHRVWIANHTSQWNHTIHKETTCPRGIVEGLLRWQLKPWANGPSAPHTLAPPCPTGHIGDLSPPRGGPVIVNTYNTSAACPQNGKTELVGAESTSHLTRTQIPSCLLPPSSRSRRRHCRRPLALSRRARRAWPRMQQSCPRF